MKTAVWVHLLVHSVVLTVTIASDFTDLLTYSDEWRNCTNREPFLTVMNKPIKTCLAECEARTACNAVNYWSVQRRCDLLSDATSGKPHRDNPDVPCVHVRKTDVITSAVTPLPASCLACADDAVCDVTNGQCSIKECRRLYIPNAKIKGNRLWVGSNVMIDCKRWFYQQPPVRQSVCQDDGTWSNVPSCVYMFECQIPPKLPHAVAYKAENDSVTSELVAVYRCREGYANDDVNAAKTLACGANQTWSEPGFQCLRNCLAPPDVENATLSAGGTVENVTRVYTCLPGHVSNDPASTTNTTCQSDGNWTTVDIQCVPAEPTTTTITSTTTTTIATTTTTTPTTTTTTPLPASCLTGWHHWGNSCYLVTMGLVRVDQSLWACETSHPGSHMLQLETAAEDVLVRGELQATYGTHNWCLGLMDWHHDTVWRWIATNTTIGYDYWNTAGGEPEGGQYYGLIRNNKWHDADDYRDCNHVCEIRWENV